ncbi:MAG: TonB-dependent receptor [Gemmatimonadetes bacterium]|uniref:TonB-dependent receptor n=1 Tax=Candidatus Kutchimonas denitrificans TaxID=3056748 RepID=A0AAE5CCN0_9BACT|nr:TonB-dependent receptor [Gemmatimonadota bacterium]NIR76188.1 TonB-dependent receptor [Candidatus Kutchimonas denitrificans]NIS00628.1 TonB-dependent receptor [Gemmatimonadota bacterium]NIT66773.1 TonB-dependent receptor [Gemmatimonadota bacterium]NIV23372.1 TonB-dependent receptor [Gemmatimonadota bacterium]
MAVCTDPAPFHCIRRLLQALAVCPSLLALAATAATAQATGRVIGRVLDADTREPVVAAEVRIENTDLTTLTTERGDFILSSVPIGEHRLKVERIGYRPVVLNVLVRAARATRLNVELPTAPVEVEGIGVEVERVRLIEPDVIESHQVLRGEELRELPVDDVEEAVELTTGVSEGRFRGGRVGQEVYRIDGLEVKNQAEAATTGTGLELAPSAVAEIDVVVGGFGADNGAALSGVVNYVTRRGNPERWDGRVQLLGDHLAPDSYAWGFTELSASAGGPLRFMGEGTTLFADLLFQGLIDADPRARGLTCLRPEDGDAQLAETIARLRDTPSAAHLYCPYTSERIPHQRGDKTIGFLRLDQQLGSNVELMASFLYNRRQLELYTPEFKYNLEHQLGQRTEGFLANLTLDWSAQHEGRIYNLIGRAALVRLDRYLGVLDPSTFSERSRVAGFGLSNFRFLGEDFTRSPIEEQLESGAAVPGYAIPGGTVGSPFGPAAEGIFFTEGTPGIANWNRTDYLATDLTGSLLSAEGHALRAGLNGRFYRVESYERALGYLTGNLPSFARFYPTTIAGYAEASLLAAHDVTLELGLRIESFQSGISFREDRANLLSPIVDAEWHTEVMPRLGMAVPVPGTFGRLMFRFNYGLVAQAPDFRFFLDTTLGDSLRANIRRQGNPNLAFERGTSWEVGADMLVTDRLSVGATGYLKQLHNLVTSSLTFSGFAENQFTTGDFGTVQGLALTVRGRWGWIDLRAGYTLQSAKGVTSSAFEDPGEGLTERRLEFPLAFDSRHQFDLTALAGRAAGVETRWSVSVTGAARSGYPLNRTFTSIEEGVEPEVGERLPWIGTLNLRTSWQFGELPLCGGCTWRAVFDGRNLLNRDNIIALRRDTGTLAPPTAELEAIADEIPFDFQPIPLESPNYSANVDLDGSGLITADEMRTGRLAAALDRNDPSLFFGSGSAMRLGIEVRF